MIDPQRDGDTLIVHVTSDRRPRLYFDQFALDTFARHPECRERFFARFVSHGELMFSHINMMEVLALRGDTASLIRDFLARIGQQWVPLEYEFDKVIAAENAPIPDAPHAALSQHLLSFVVESRPAGAPVTLDAIIDEIATDDPDQHREFLAQVKSAMATHVAVWQERALAEFPVISHAGPTLHVLTALVRLLVKERKSHKWMPNDAFDFAHALVPLVYADAIFLDRHWKNRIERMNLKGPLARVFYGYEADAFLDWFERFDQA